LYGDLTPFHKYSVVRILARLERTRAYCSETIDRLWYSGYKLDFEILMTNKLILAVLVILFSSGIAHAQADCTLFNLYGALIIPVRDHPEKFTVFLKPHGGDQEFMHTYIDLNGRFFFENVPLGTYDVYTKIDGFKEMRERVDFSGHMGGQDNCKQNEIYWLRPEDTEVVVDERLRGYPKAAIDEYVLAVTADSKKQYKEVAAHLENVVRLAPDWYDAHCELGVAYEELNRLGDAEKEYRKALELKPDGFRAIMSLSRLLILVADEKIQNPATKDAGPPLLSVARELLKNATTIDPMSAMAAYLLGAVDFRLASYKNAETELKQALELDKSIFPARVTLINVYIAQQQWQNALDNVDTFLLENPDTVYRQQVMGIRSSILRRATPNQ
jgi:tetratricopeptide (TPR) repeat protein